MNAERTYRLEPLDTSGVFLGLGVVQSILLGGSLTLGVVVISAGLPVLVAGIPVIIAVGLSFGRLGGRVAWEWLPILTSWLVRHVAWGERWFAPLPLWPTTADVAPELPPCLSGLSLHDVPWHEDEEIGCVRDGRRRSLTALVPVLAPRFIVETAGEQERLLSGWGDVLAQFAGDRSAVSHLSWSDLTRPSSLQEHTEWLTSQKRDADLGPTESYADLLDMARANATVHDVIVTITVNRDRLRRRRGDAEDEHDTSLERALGTAVDGLLRGLRSAGLAPERPLSALALQQTLRTRIDPTHQPPSRTRGRLAERMGLVASASPGPLVVDTAWSHLRTDGSWHRTFWTATWPRLAVPPCWLEPFLAADVTRSMTVVLVPVSSWQSRRRIERDLVKLESDATTKPRSTDEVCG